MSQFPYDVIISHGPNCNDGSTAAWCFWRQLDKGYRELLRKEGGFYARPSNARGAKNEKEKAKPEPTKNGEHYIHPNSVTGAIKLQERKFPVVFVFLQPTEHVPFTLIKNKRVLILDLDTGDELLKIVSGSISTFVVDHHESSNLTLAKYGNIIKEKYGDKFSTLIRTEKSESGATLAWKLSHGNNMHPFIEIVRIGDNWQWKDYPYLNAKCVLRSLGQTRAFRSFEDIEETYNTWDKNFNTYVQDGRTIVAFENSLLQKIAKKCDIGYIQTNDGTVYTVAYTQANVGHSEIGAMMRSFAEQRFKNKIHFSATWKYMSHAQVVSVSLRDGCGIDLAYVARNVKNTNNKGGGHIDASSFTFKGIENLHKYILREAPDNYKPPCQQLSEP